MKRFCYNGESYIYEISYIDEYFVFVGSYIGKFDKNLIKTDSPEETERILHEYYTSGEEIGQIGDLINP